MAATIKTVLLEKLDPLTKDDLDAVLSRRYQKFRRLGRYLEE
jgi:acetyl-CoA carboxylase alpha subunit